MQFVVDGLNKPNIRKYRGDLATTRRRRPILPASDMEIELRRLVEEWKRSGPNLRKLFDQEPELAAFSKRGQFTFYPTDTGRGHLEWSPSDVIQGISPSEELARDRFMMLITNPQWATLSGPCLACGNYFLKKADRPRVYCSSRCGSKASAIKSTETKRERDHAEKVKEAQALIEEWKEKPRRQGWKVWIVGKGLIRRDLMFTTRWLSRAVNRRELLPPTLDAAS